MSKLLLSGITFLGGLGIGAAMIANQMNQIVRAKHTNGENFRILFDMLERWIIRNQDEKRLEEYFLRHGYNRIGVYGLGRVGTLFINEMNDSSIEIVYGIDKKADKELEFTIYHPEQDLPNVDAIVITAIAYIDEIYDLLKKKMKCPIISIEEIVYDV